jgi:hypothetical protein
MDRESKDQLETRNRVVSESLEWSAVIGFFVAASLVYSALNRFISSEKLVGEIAFLLGLLILHFVLRVIVKAESGDVVNHIAGAFVVVIQLLLSFVMRMSWSIAIAIAVFILVREIIKRLPWFGHEEKNVALGSVILTSMLVGGLAFVISELALRIWLAWRTV